MVISELNDSIINNSYLLDCRTLSENVFLDLTNELNVNMLSSVLPEYRQFSMTGSNSEQPIVTYFLGNRMEEGISDILKFNSYQDENGRQTLTNVTFFNILWNSQRSSIATFASIYVRK